MRTSAEDREDDSYLSQLGWTRRRVPYEWDDPTEFLVVVDRDKPKYATGGRMEGVRPVWEQEQ